MMRCVARKKDFERCSNPAEKGSIFCRRHRWWLVLTLFGSLIVLTTIGANVSQMFGITFSFPMVPQEVASVTPVATQTPTPTITLTPSLPPSVVSTPTPTDTVEDQLVKLIDNYYTCINVANPDFDTDFEECWNLLSDKPGEFQSNLNKNDSIEHWKKYKVIYDLYYCSKGLQRYVDAEYYLYDRSDLSIPIGNGATFYLEFSFALDDKGWRITGADDSINSIGSYCEKEPRIKKSTLVP